LPIEPSHTTGEKKNMIDFLLLAKPMSQASVWIGMTRENRSMGAVAFFGSETEETIWLKRSTEYWRDVDGEE